MEEFLEIARNLWPLAEKKQRSEALLVCPRSNLAIGHAVCGRQLQLKETAWVRRTAAALVEKVRLAEGEV